MYLDYWGLRQSPFRCGGANPIHRGGPQIEALARMHYLTTGGMRIGLLVGQPGAGKSTLLSVLSRELRADGRAVAMVSLLGLDPLEFTWQLARKLGCPLDFHPGMSVIWTLIAERLGILEYHHLGVVLLLDHMEGPGEDLRLAVRRLAAHAQCQGRGPAILLATTVAGIAELGRELTEACDLRIDLEPWALEETASYLEGALASVGRGTPAFDVRAIETIQRISGGIPRRVIQLAELSLIAAAGDQLHLVDEQTVCDAHLELTIGGVASPLAA